MINKEILQSDLLDILFENRNKAYGAYALRRTYPQRLKWALAISLGLALGLSILDFSGARNSDHSFVEKTVTLSKFDVSPEKPRQPDLPRPKVKPHVAQAAYISRIQIVNDNVQTQMPTMKQLDTSMTSTKTVVGIGTHNNSDEDNGEGSDTNKSDGQKKDTHREEPTALTQADAQFPGGKEALAKFLTRFLVTPGDLETGEKRVVVVRFKVDTDGTISNAEIIRSDGDEYSKEVMRVLGKMPKWIPAMQNGEKVATWFSQPVSFLGGDQ